ncbi:heavy-metal-associated domain-containing protein [Microbacterium album]|uniref:Metal-binding protein n=1 Tax=Microbacterium album TaxID=2053191 RepID=A0A917MM68_9MICO|nr:heavy-metal-associated domain-containing protein [Microbacterium album]GGH46590.1 metal-binding protein [Microbacterium album]
MISTTHHVRGMTCSHCAAAVGAEVRALPGVTEVEVDVPAGRVTVHAETDVPDAAVADAVSEAGYAWAGRA